MCKHVGPSRWSHVLQTDRGVIDTEGVLARLAQVEEADACHIGNGKHVIVCIIRGVSVMWDGAHNCNGNRFHLFGWSILFGVPSKLSAKLEVNVSVTIHLDVRGPHPFEVSETEPDCVGLWLVVRQPPRILLPMNFGCSAKSAEVSWGSME